MNSNHAGEQNQLVQDQKVASYLALTYDEYIGLEPSIKERVGDDGLLYCYLVTFGKTVPAHLAIKIRDLDDMQTSLPPGFFESDVPEWPQG